MTGYIKKASLAMAVSHTVREDNIQREFARQLAHNAVMDNTIAKDRSKPKPKKKSLTKTASLMTAIEALSGYNLASRAGLSATKEVAEQRNELLQNAGVNPVDHLSTLDDIRDARRNIMASRPVPVVINSAISGAVSGLSTLRLLRGFGVPGNGPANYALGVGGAAALLSAARAIYKGRQDGEAIGGLRDKVDGNVQAALNISSTIDPRVVNALYGGYDHINRDGDLLKRASEGLSTHVAVIKNFHKNKASLLNDIEAKEDAYDMASFKEKPGSKEDSLAVREARRALKDSGNKYYKASWAHHTASNKFVSEASGGNIDSHTRYNRMKDTYKNEVNAFGGQHKNGVPYVAGAGAAAFGALGAIGGAVDKAATPSRLLHTSKAKAVLRGAKMGGIVGALTGVAMTPLAYHNYSKAHRRANSIHGVTQAMKHHGLTDDHFSA